MNDAVQVLALRATDRAPAGDATAFRLRLSHLLERADLRPPGMPPAAVLIVRTLADPLPGALCPRPAGTADPAWERAGRAALAAAWSSAARPARGAVANDALAVAFADEGEWLACLLDDLANHRARWWWRPLTTASPAATTLSAATLAHRHSLPAAFARLAGDRRVLVVASQIAAGDATRLAELLAADAGLPALHCDAARAGATPGVAERLDESNANANANDGTPNATAASSTGSASELAVPTRFATAVLHLAEQAGLALSPLPSAQRLLVALAVGLQRWPRALREAAAAPGGRFAPARPTLPAASFRRAVPDEASDAGTKGTPHTKLQPDATPISLVAMNGETGRDERPARWPPRPEQHDGDAPKTGPSSHAPGKPPATAEPAIDALVPIDRWPESSPPADQRAGPTCAAPRLERAADSAALTTSGATCASAPQTTDARRVWPDDGLPSGLAGVGFLINLMRHLDLPDAFEPRYGLKRRLGPWATLAALASGLLDDPSADDALWAALDALAGPPPADEPAADRAAAVFRWPPGWLARAGIKRAPRRPPAIPPATARRVGAPLEPLFARLLPVVRQRLQGALGDTSPAAMLRRPGRIYLTATHLDLVLPLAAISLPARRAGLDRDPGWLPGWGRVVLFHFE